MAHYYAHGKVLLSGEYVILDGALGIGLPTKLGQHLYVETSGESDYVGWESWQGDQEKWLEVRLDPDQLRVLKTTDAAMGERLSEVLRVARELSGGAFNPGPARVRTVLEFDRSWGLGSSSTLLSLVARWAGVDVYDLANRTFGGSGYDLACAVSDGPVLYQRREGRGHHIRIPFDPPFADDLYFVYLGHKQNSRSGIKRYKEAGATPPVEAISQLSLGLVSAKKRTEFADLLLEHESLIASCTSLKPVGEQLFPDAPGVLKSLGAWGGDYLLFVSEVPESGVRAYFTERGYTVLHTYRSFVL